MKIYKIAYQYTTYGTINIQAESLEAAKELALEASVNNEGNEHYLDQSFEIDEEGTALYNDAHKNLIDFIEDQIMFRDED
jgi:hypothetical protein